MPRALVVQLGAVFTIVYGKEVSILALPRAVALIGLVVVAAVFAACASGPAGPGSVMVPVTEVKSVAGRWAGTLARDTASREDWVRVTIDQDGTYDFSSARQIGVVTGKGKLSVKDGKLVGEGPRGTSVYTLYDRGGKQMLIVDVRLNDGATYSAVLGRDR
ncbi:MAG TPA: hypothetical protein VLK35_19485 [Methylomirabilota bacterium]|nr:hypothetical protein [Methylomirabilota bacterium]